MLRAKAFEISPLLDLQAGAGSLHARLYEGLRQAILSGRLPPGSRLPSSRALAQEFAIARNTVTGALEQLASEGYLRSKSGSGTFVSAELPDPASRPLRRPSPRLRPSAGPQASDRGRALAGNGHVRDVRLGAFAPGLADYENFPFGVWARLLGRVWRRPHPDLLLPGEPAGYEPLRVALAQHLRLFRAVRCDAEQVLIVTGARHAVDLAARVLLEQGDAVWLENPGYLGLRSALAGAGATVVPVPVDHDGLQVEAGRQRAPQARLACVAPSHQYPLGSTMSVARRLELLAWAREANAWILEDDYDSEYRYQGRPLAALQGLDRDGRVIYVGSFSKVMFSSLRLGYMVVPAHLVDTFRRARSAYDDPPSMVAQAALAEFMSEGHFTQHIRRMRKLYAERQSVLLAAARAELAGLLEFAPDAAGMHLLGRFSADLARRIGDEEAAARAARFGVVVSALSRYYLEPPSSRGFLLGYAHVREEAIAPAVKKLAQALSF